MLPPSQVRPALSHALRYSSATALRCSSLIVCRARVTVGPSFSFPFGIRTAADVAGQSGPRGGRGVTPELRRVLEEAFPGEEARYFAPCPSAAARPRRTAARRGVLGRHPAHLRAVRRGAA